MNTCTVNWFSYVDCYSYASNSRTQSLNTLCLHTNFTKFVHNLQFVKSLSASKANLIWAACIVNWLCVHLYTKLALQSLVQQTYFVNTCTVNWFSYVDCYSYASNSRTQSLNTLCLHTNFTQFAKFVHNLQFIKSLSASKANLIWAAHKNLRSACFSSS